MPQAPAQGNDGVVQRLARLGLRVTSALAFLAPLCTRIVLGVGFLIDGNGKIHHLDKVTGFFSDSGIPFPGANAAFISVLELIGGVALVLGLGTRIFAALLSCTMLVAVLTADRDTFVQKFNTDVSTITDVSSFTYLIILIWLVFYGPGSVSIDRFLSKWLGLNQKTGEAS